MSPNSISDPLLTLDVNERLQDGGFGRLKETSENDTIEIFRVTFLTDSQ